MSSANRFSDKDFEKLDKARKILGLGELTSTDEIKKQFHEKLKKYHPDSNQKNTDAHLKTVEIIQSYELIMKYCQQYEISFQYEEYLKQKPLPELFNSDSAEYYKWWTDAYKSFF